ncbi:hypothetical protein I553_6128 [Mycobacterium xenopi 4042]|uniref:DUF7064 domain-containing protein n=1 Tax=Mycobacterium xenopi 4042 TaxID=1299334 RepID=X8BGE4_MYCXE|nr:hypothetical protein I553_6128 [Mycobacterium xenopi 4042]
MTWATDGTPYRYRLTTRYEIPCRVSGSVTVEDTEYMLDEVPGQRDHSWGVRDWWAMDWLWSALHLDDGTHLHGVDIRIPGAPKLCVGYLQQKDRQLVELHTVTSRESFDSNGLPVAATVSVEPGDIAATAAVRGHAPLLLVADDGRVSQFPARGSPRPQPMAVTGLVGWNGTAPDGSRRRPEPIEASRPKQSGPGPIVVMGVSGSGKSTVGAALARRLGSRSRMPTHSTRARISPKWPPVSR